MDNQQGKLESRLHWLGGFWDGEGTVTLNYRHTWRGRYSALTPNLSIVNTNKTMIDEVADIFDQCSVPYYRQYWDNAKNPKHRPRHSIIIAGMKRCSKALPFLIPYLVGKREKATKLQQFVEFRLSRPYQAPYTEYEVGLASEIREGRFDSKSLIDYMPGAAVEAVKV